ncbi:Hypothetical protein POVN_LOCUS85 [uncultured virus]|nr:Hypothetical protein POVN_LOCUS85 [uncultured virus]
MAGYRFLAVPTYTGITLDKGDLEAVYDAVHVRYGSHALHPVVVQALAAQVEHDAKEPCTRKEGAIALAILQELVKAEHTVGYELYKRASRQGAGVPMSESDTKVQPLRKVKVHYKASTKSKYVLELWQAVGRHTFRPEMLNELVTDLYICSDAVNLFKSPPEEGEMDTKGKQLVLDETAPILAEPRTVHAGLLVAPLADTLLAKEAKYAPDRLSTALVLLSDEYEYCGHIYMWDNPNEKGVEVRGIRSGLFNHITKRVPAVSLKIFHGVALWAQQRSHNVIWVDPLPVMRDILTAKLGFKEHAPTAYYHNQVGDVLSRLSKRDDSEAKATLQEYGVQLPDLLLPLTKLPAFEADLQLWHKWANIDVPYSRTQEFMTRMFIYDTNVWFHSEAPWYIINWLRRR